MFDQASSDRDWWKWMQFCEAVDVDSGMPEPLCLLTDAPYSQTRAAAAGWSAWGWAGSWRKRGMQGEEEGSPCCRECSPTKTTA
ncbi:unnamed protein product [Coregonus sp. 'balchen']|nr:unnamed protein product [Coregonus sp. 'balchen']